MCESFVKKRQMSVVKAELTVGTVKDIHFFGCLCLLSTSVILIQMHHWTEDFFVVLHWFVFCIES